MAGKGRFVPPPTLSSIQGKVNVVGGGKNETAWMKASSSSFSSPSQSSQWNIAPKYNEGRRKGEGEGEGEGESMQYSTAILLFWRLVLRESQSLPLPSTRRLAYWIPGLPAGPKVKTV